MEYKGMKEDERLISVTPSKRQIAYQNMEYFSMLFKKNTGQTPTEYVRNNRNKKTEAEAANDAAKDAKNE